jgi:hypothetical protein
VDVAVDVAEAISRGFGLQVDGEGFGLLKNFNLENIDFENIEFMPMLQGAAQSLEDSGHGRNAKFIFGSFLTILFMMKYAKRKRVVIGDAGKMLLEGSFTDEDNPDLATKITAVQEMLGTGDVPKIDPVEIANVYRVFINVLKTSERVKDLKEIGSNLVEIGSKNLKEIGSNLVETGSKNLKEIGSKNLKEIGSKASSWLLYNIGYSCILSPEQDPVQDSVQDPVQDPVQILQQQAAWGFYLFLRQNEADLDLFLEEARSHETITKFLRDFEKNEWDLGTKESRRKEAMDWLQVGLKRYIIRRGTEPDGADPVRLLDQARAVREKTERIRPATLFNQRAQELRDFYGRLLERFGSRLDWRAQPSIEDTLRRASKHQLEDMKSEEDMALYLLNHHIPSVTKELEKRNSGLLFIRRITNHLLENWNFEYVHPTYWEGPGPALYRNGERVLKISEGYYRKK